MLIQHALQSAQHCSSIALMLGWQCNVASQLNLQPRTYQQQNYSSAANLPVANSVTIRQSASLVVDVLA